MIGKKEKLIYDIDSLDVYRKFLTFLSKNISNTTNNSLEHIKKFNFV